MRLNTMTKKEAFIQAVKDYIFNNEEVDLYNSYDEEVVEQIYNYWEDLQKVPPPRPSVEITEIGMKILSFFRAKPHLKMTARELGESMLLSPQTVAGAMKKLVADGYIKKIQNTKPTLYKITKKGQEYNFH